MNEYTNSLDFACRLDNADELHHFRGRFHFPCFQDNTIFYFCGNSLGLMPKTVQYALLHELEDWHKYGVEGHFMARNPWFSYHTLLREPLAMLTGGLPSEVVCMNTLTVNLHLMMVSFYRPTQERFKIIIEAGAFPSDYYTVETQIAFHGYNPETALIEIAPREGETTLRTEDIVRTIEEHGSSVALVLFSGVQYQTGQRFDMKAITEAAHSIGAKAGFDLAHAIGNVELALHDWDVDFAAWCSYKYLNSGPGGIGGVFVHERHGSSPDVPRFGGWWGYEESTRFQMKKGFKPSQGADGWQLSNAQVFQMAALKASLDIFQEAGFDTLCAKRDQLTAFLEFHINDMLDNNPAIPLTVLTPKEKEQRGAQLSLAFSERGKELHKKLTDIGFIGDWREPNIIRIAPAPLYNSFTDIYHFRTALETLCAEMWTH